MMYCVVGARGDAVPATDAGCAVRCLEHRDIELAYLLAYFAGSAAVRIDFEPIERYGVEQSVDRAEWTDIPAEWAIHDDRSEDGDCEDQVLPSEKPTRDTSESRIPGQQEQSGQRSRRTDP